MVPSITSPAGPLAGSKVAERRVGRKKSVKRVFRRYALHLVTVTGEIEDRMFSGSKAHRTVRIWCQHVFYLLAHLSCQSLPRHVIHGCLQGWNCAHGQIWRRRVLDFCFPAPTSILVLFDSLYRTSLAQHVTPLRCGAKVVRKTVLHAKRAVSPFCPLDIPLSF